MSPQNSVQAPTVVPSSPGRLDGQRPPRRSLLRAAMAGAAALLFGRRTATASSPTTQPGGLAMEGPPLTTHVYRGRPPVEPLDTMIRFERADNHEGRAMTHEILSLIHEEKGPRSYPWTIYSHLTTHHVEGDACVLCSRLHKNGRGWSCGLHSEVFNSAPAVALGVNVEMTNDYAGPETTQVIGVNVQSHGSQPCQFGIQVHDWDGRFEKAIGLNGKGDVGLDLSGTFSTGVHLRHNNLRLNEGACIELDGAGKVRIRYRQGRIEFLNGDKCVAHIVMDGEDRAL